jgi:hypothetical protein
MASTIPAGFLDSSSAGVPAGAVLTPYTGPMRISKDGTVVENKIINGTLDITGDNVVVGNIYVGSRLSGGPVTGISITNNVIAEGATATTPSSTLRRHSPALSSSRQEPRSIPIRHLPVARLQTPRLRPPL